MYNAVKAALEQHPELTIQIMSYYKVKTLLQKLSRVVPLIHDMCIKSCIGFTGPYKDLESCPHCGKHRYTKVSGSIPRKQFNMIPIGPQLQALWRSADSAKEMLYRQNYTERILDELARTEGIHTSPFRDFFDGTNYLYAVLDGKIKPGDMVLIFSMDGAQLYWMKMSDCWIYIWIILDLSPNACYKKKCVLPGGFIPGPEKLKNLDSFVFPGLHHLAAIQRDGLTVWSALDNTIFKSHPFLALVTTDGPAMAALSRCVGHHGKHGCRLYCPLIGHRKEGGPHYYPVLKKPQHYTMTRCNHDNVNILDLLASFTSQNSRRHYCANVCIVAKSCNKTQYSSNRLTTGICKPTIFLGLPMEHTLGVLLMFPGDSMHLPALNMTDLYISLWRGTIDIEKLDDRTTWKWAVLVGNCWKEHGKLVAAATPYIPGSFDRPPQNIAEKITSGYKAWEFLQYFFGLGPARLYGLLPEPFYGHYCKIVLAICILLQEEIDLLELKEVDRLLVSAANQFKDIYIEEREDCLHFACQSGHMPLHLPCEVEQIGPGIIYSQWPIERTIDNIKEEMKQHSNAFANMQQCGIRRCQVNALKAMVPDLMPSSASHPKRGIDLESGYLLLGPLDSTWHHIRPHELEALKKYKESCGDIVADDWNPLIMKWARLQLPNSQIVWCHWKEESQAMTQIQISRNVKVSIYH